jgi:hypothetical protein
MVIQKLYPWQILLENSLKKSAEQQIKQQPIVIQQNYKPHIWRCWKKTFCQTRELLFYLIFQKIIHIYVKMPSKGSTGKLVRPLSTLLYFIITYQDQKIAWKKSV